jgi:NIMA (never in mitosis gene a)-related kinase
MVRTFLIKYVTGGDLQNKIKEQRGKPFSEAQILEWFTQICLGLKHIHDRKILHRDLKGQNIFLTSKGIVKIGDFGIAKVLANTMQNARTVVGTPYYLSPEIVNSKPYNFKSDMWSMGVILYELCALKPPFDAPSLHFLAMKIVRGAFNPLPNTFSSEMKSLVGQLLNVNDRNRPDVNKVLAMPIMQNRIKVFLTETIYNKEFSHTILHK